MCKVMLMVGADIIQIPVSRLNGLFAYILAGWKNVHKFLGLAVVSVMKDMGNVLYELLLKNDLLQPCESKTLRKILNYVTDACQTCLIPVSAININASENTLTIELIEKKESRISENLKKDDSWAFLPFPMISLLYFLLSKNLGLPSAPVKFTMDYKDGVQWMSALVSEHPP